MKYNCFFVLLSVLLAVPPLRAAQPQRKQPKSGDTVNTPGLPTNPSTSGGKGGESVAIPKRVSTVTLREKPVQANEGALVLIAATEAKITLTPLRDNKLGKPLNYTLDKNDDTLNLANMTPGAYRLSIKHPDYSPVSKDITIEKGKVTPVTRLLISKYGEIIIGGASKEASATLDNNKLQLAPDEQGRLIIKRVPVGEHELKIAQPHCDDWLGKVIVKPGETTPVTAEMKLATVKLTVKSKPNARIYLNDEEKGIIQPDGAVAVSNLLPDSYKMRVMLDGFEDFGKQLELTLDNRQPVETVELTPIAESGEATENFLTGTAKWAPVPAAWGLDKRGMKIAGEGLGLFKDAGEKRPFNVYRDFKLDFDIRFNNGKGAAWVLRAKDINNYYLCELTTLKHAAGGRRFNFYLCQNGKCELKNSFAVAENLERPNDTYQISIEARGPELTHKIRLGSTPRTDDPQPLGTFRDETFAYGGIGFRGLNGIEMLVQNFVVVPQTKK